MQMENAARKSSIIEILVGVLTLVVGIFYLSPIRMLSISLMIQMGIIAYFILSIVLVLVAAPQLIGTFWYEIKLLPEWLVLVTSILIIAPMVSVLFFQMISVNFNLFHYLFGISLASYAISQIAIGAISKGQKRTFRAFAAGFGTAIGVLAGITFVFKNIIISKTTESNGSITINSLSFGTFVNLAFILIGISLLLPSINALRKQKQTMQVTIGEQEV